MKLRSLLVPLCSALLLLTTVSAFSQTDPGLRTPSTPAAGGPLPSVAGNNPLTILDFFNDGKDRFEEIDSVAGTLPGEAGKGLGPRYNSRGCARCHAFPATGGTSPAINPQVTDASADGATNFVPPFVRLSGPVLEARFVYFTDASGTPITSDPDGGVHDLYTIVGRSDANTCITGTITQPDFASAIANNNIVFRIPTPVFGTGLVENIDETDLLAFRRSNVGNPFGISGTFNHNGNDGTISRFGWKAQNKSLEIFSGEAYNVEMGVSNELFTNERPNPEEDRKNGLPSQCKLNPTPEDHTNFNTTPIATQSDTVQFAMFMRLLAPPTPSTSQPGGGPSIKNGKSLFKDIGCSTCHAKTFTTFLSAITPSLGTAAIEPLSDFEIHHMGSGLADNVSQGQAGGDQFRTAPLWGLGQRIFLLHDGRTSDLVAAINAHFSTGSEANTAKLNYDALSTMQKQDLLNYLRSL